MEYTWIISDLNAKISEEDLANVIKTVHWHYQAEDTNGNIADVLDKIANPTHINITLQQEQWH